MNRPDSVVKIATTLKDFFKNWLQFLKPFHGLREKQIVLAAAFLAERYRLGMKITDDEMLDTLLLSTDIKRKIREEMGMPASNFQVLLGDLRRHGFFIGNRVNPKYVPNLKPSSKSYSLLLYFPIEEDGQSGEETV